MSVRNILDGTITIGGGLTSESEIDIKELSSRIINAGEIKTYKASIAGPTQEAGIPTVLEYNNITTPSITATESITTPVLAATG